MIERKRQARRYQQVPGDDVELGEGVPSSAALESGGTFAGTPSLEDQLEHWDENAEDDDELTESNNHVTRPPEDGADADRTSPSKERHE